MSSNFTVNRICENCGNVFAARTTVTRFCSHVCNRRHLKAKVRAQKMAPMDAVVKKILDPEANEIATADYLNVKDAAKLLKASDKMIYRLINIGKIHAVNLSARKTLVRRTDIDKIFDLPPVVKIKKFKKPPISECYHMAEAQELFNISESALFHIIKRHKLFKFQEGWYTYVAKSDLDKIFKIK